jgi:hypothetical protein
MVSDEILFVDQDVRAECPRFFEESRATRAEEFGGIDARCADKLVAAAHMYFEYIYYSV